MSRPGADELSVVVVDGQIGFRRRCYGPLWYADQGIVCCETCEPFGCICCDHEDVDHSKARYRCLPDRDGKCLIVGHEGHDCARDAHKEGAP